MARAIDADIPRTVDAYGRTWFSADSAIELTLRGYDIADLLIHSNPDIVSYNQWCDRLNKTDHKIDLVPTVPDNAKRANTWWLDDRYAELDVRRTILDRCHSAQERTRVNHEMDLFEARDLIQVLRLMMMLVEHFRHNNIVWGVGRGSSVASYVLFLIGIHKIDSLFYDLDITEFLRGDSLE